MAVLFGIIYLLLLLVFPEKASDASADALTLWAGSVVPSLLPNYCASMLMIQSGAIFTLGKALNRPAKKLLGLPGCGLCAILISYTCGFPTGAAVIGELNKSKALTNAQARNVCSFASCCSPGFILGACASFAKTSGYIMLFCHLLGAVICGYLFKTRLTDSVTETPSDIKPLPFTQAISISLSKGGSAMVSIGASMVFFTVLLSTAFSNSPVASFFIEMTVGCRAVSLMFSSKKLTCALICACVSFGGLCIYMQSEPSLSSFISPVRYLFQKIVHGLISGILCFLFTAG